MNFVVTRHFDAPRQLVWDTWTKPEHVVKWWGPRQYGTGSEQVKMDVRTGGSYLFPMVGPDGSTTWSGGTYEEVTPISRIKCTDSFMDAEGNRVRASYYPGFPEGWPEVMPMTVDFTEEDRGTCLTITYDLVDDPKIMQMIADNGMEEGWHQSLDKFAEVVEERKLVISRLVDAPQHLVWQAFSQPEHLIKWWGPTGFTNTFEKFEFREGGEWLFMMHGPDGKDWPNKIVFTTIHPEEYVAYDHSDQDGNDAFKADIRMDKQGDRTMVTLSLCFDSKAARDEKVRAVGAIDGGFQTLSKLAKHVETM